MITEKDFLPRDYQDQKFYVPMFGKYKLDHHSILVDEIPENHKKRLEDIFRYGTQGEGLSTEPFELENQIRFISGVIFREFPYLGLASAEEMSKLRETSRENLRVDYFHDFGQETSLSQVAKHKQYNCASQCLAIKKALELKDWNIFHARDLTHPKKKPKRHVVLAKKIDDLVMVLDPAEGLWRYDDYYEHLGKKHSYQKQPFEFFKESFFPACILGDEEVNT